jgi:hypothetical protein
MQPAAPPAGGGAGTPAADAAAAASSSNDEELSRLRAENRTLRAALAALAGAPRAPTADGAAAGAGAAASASASATTPAAPPPLSWVDPCGHGLSSSQLARYARHTALPSFGTGAQGALCSARVLLVGAGGLGSSAALYLAAAGVGTLGIADSDVVELSNLQRQVIHTEARAPRGMACATSAPQRAQPSHVPFFWGAVLRVCAVLTLVPAPSRRVWAAPRRRPRRPRCAR